MAPPPHSVWRPVYLSCRRYHRVTYFNLRAGITCAVNLMERAPSQVLPQTICVVLFKTERNKFGEGVNRFGSTGSSVIVTRLVGVKIAVGVSVANASPVAAVTVDSAVFITKKSGVLEAGNANGVAVG